MENNHKLLFNLLTLALIDNGDDTPTTPITTKHRKEHIFVTKHTLAAFTNSRITNINTRLRTALRRNFKIATIQYAGRPHYSIQDFLTFSETLNH